MNPRDPKRGSDAGLIFPALDTVNPDESAGGVPRTSSADSPPIDLAMGTMASAGVGVRIHPEPKARKL